MIPVSLYSIFNVNQTIAVNTGFEDDLDRGIAKQSFSDLMALYGHNFALLMLLSSKLPSINQPIILKTRLHIDLYMEPLDQSKYTTTMLLTYIFHKDLDIAQIPNLYVRLYHDAQLAEVRLYDNSGKTIALPVKLPENGSEFNRRWVVNIFLKKWLKYCCHQKYFFLRAETET